MARRRVPINEPSQQSSKKPQFVLADPDKRAIQSQWQNKYPSTQQIRQHLQTDGNRVGLVPWSVGCVVVDVDSGDPGQVVKALGEPLASVTTPSGGSHLWYRASQAIRNGKWTHGDASGDLRGGSGYVCLYEGNGFVRRLVEQVDQAAAVDLTPILPPTPNQAPAPQKEWEADEENLTSALETLDPDMAHDDWVRVLMALHSEGREDLARQWSSRGSKWDERVFNTKWQSFKGDGITVGTLYQMAGQAGWERPNKQHGGARKGAGRKPSELVQKQQNDFDSQYSDLQMADRVAGELTKAGAQMVFGLVTGHARQFDGTRIGELSETQAMRIVGNELNLVAADIAFPENFQGDEKERNALIRSINKCRHILRSRGKATAVYGFLKGDTRLGFAEESIRVPDHLWPMPNGHTLDLSDLSTHETTFVDQPWLIGGCVPQEGPTPAWDQLLSDINEEDGWIGDAVEEALGEAMQGGRTRQFFHTWVGQGRNGKGTILRVAKQIFGDFFLQALRGTFFEDGRQSDRHDAHLLQHIGRRLVVCPDPQGRPKETMLLNYSGQDQVVGEIKGGASISFTPTARLVFNGQEDRLHFDGIDQAMSARMRQTPFQVTFAGREDDTLEQRLVAELPAIAWRIAIRARDYLASGHLEEASRQRAQTQEWADEQDVVGRFLEACCQPDETGTITNSALWEAWSHWCDRNGERARSKRFLTQQLKKRRDTYKLSPDRASAMGGRYWRGARILNSEG